MLLVAKWAVAVPYTEARVMVRSRERIQVLWLSVRPASEGIMGPQSGRRYANLYLVVRTAVV